MKSKNDVEHELQKARTELAYYLRERTECDASGPERYLLLIAIGQQIKAYQQKVEQLTKDLEQFSPSFPTQFITQ